MLRCVRSGSRGRSPATAHRPWEGSGATASSGTGGVPGGGAAGDVDARLGQGPSEGAPQRPPAPGARVWPPTAPSSGCSSSRAPGSRPAAILNRLPPPPAPPSPRGAPGKASGPGAPRPARPSPPCPALPYSLTSSLPPPGSAGDPTPASPTAPRWREGAVPALTVSSASPRPPSYCRGPQRSPHPPLRPALLSGAGLPASATPTAERVLLLAAARPCRRRSPTRLAAPLPWRPASPAPGAAHGRPQARRGARALPLGPQRLPADRGGRAGGAAPISNGSQGPAARLGSRPRAPAGTGSGLTLPQPLGRPASRREKGQPPRGRAAPPPFSPRGGRSPPSGAASLGAGQPPAPARPHSRFPAPVLPPAGGARPHDSISKGLVAFPVRAGPPRPGSRSQRTAEPPPWGQR